MTKLEVSKGMTQAELYAGVAQNYRSGGASTAMKIVEKALEAYKKTAVKLHIAACVSLYHAAETGDTRPLNSFFRELRQNDKDGLRKWIGEHAKITVTEDEEAEPVEKSWIKFSKDAGFTIIKGTEAIRKGYFDLEHMLAEASFQDTKQVEPKAIGLAEILAMLAKVQKQAESKADSNGVALPLAIKRELSNLTAVVASIPMPTASASA